MSPPDIDLRPLPAASLLKLPRQRRSVDMVHALLDAAIVVLQAEGTHGFSTNRVAEVAGASPGSLYQYFSSKEMLIAGVVERGLMESEVLMRTSVAEHVDGPVEVAMEALIRTVLEDLRPYDRLLREVLQMTPFWSPTGFVTVIETRVADLLRDWLTQHADRVRPVAGAASVLPAARAAVYLVLRQLSDPWAALDDDRFIAAVVPMLCGALVEVGVSAA